MTASVDWAGFFHQIRSGLDQYGLMLAAMLAAGLFSGFVAGLFGIGGGFVVVPALAAVLSVFCGNRAASADNHVMHVAIGTSLASIVFTSLRSVQAHAKRGAVDFGILKSWMVWVIVGVIIGVLLTGFLDGRALAALFGAGVFFMGLHFLFPILEGKAPAAERLPTGPLRAALGSTLGAFSSLLGIGGGTPAVLIMTMSGVQIHRAVATAAGFGTIIAVPGAIGNMLVGFNTPNLPFGSIGFVNIFALAAITATSVLTAPLGAAAAHRLDGRMLRRVFGVYLLFTSAVMLRDSLPLDWLRPAIGA